MVQKCVIATFERKIHVFLFLSVLHCLRVHIGTGTKTRFAYASSKAARYNRIVVSYDFKFRRLAATWVDLACFVWMSASKTDRAGSELPGRRRARAQAPSKPKQKLDTMLLSWKHVPFNDVMPGCTCGCCTQVQLLVLRWLKISGGRAVHIRRSTGLSWSTHAMDQMSSHFA